MGLFSLLRKGKRWSSQRFTPSFEEIFKRMGAFPLSDCVSCAVEERYGYDVLMSWPASIPIEHRVAHLVWSMTGYLECEGFARFFNANCHHPAYPECLEILGLPALAQVIRESLQQVPENAFGDTDALIAHFGSWERLVELTDHAETTLFAASDAIQQAHVTYVRVHQVKFEDLLPEMRLQHAYKEFMEHQDKP